MRAAFVFAAKRRKCSLRIFNIHVPNWPIFPFRYKFTSGVINYQIIKFTLRKLNEKRSFERPNGKKICSTYVIPSCHITQGAQTEHSFIFVLYDRVRRFVLLIANENGAVCDEEREFVYIYEARTDRKDWKRSCKGKLWTRISVEMNYIRNGIAFSCAEKSEKIWACKFGLAFRSDVPLRISCTHIHIVRVWTTRHSRQPPSQQSK